MSLVSCSCPALAGIHATAADYVRMVKLLAATAIGVFLACLVSFTVFPTRALGSLKRLMASSLERMANLSFQVLGELCQVTAPQAPHHCAGLKRPHFQGWGCTAARDWGLLTGKLRPVL